VVNSNVVSSLVSVGASTLVLAITAVLRTVSNGFKEMKSHLNRQDLNMTGISERVAKIEGSLGHTTNPGG